MSETEALSLPGGDRDIEERCRLFQRAWSAGPMPPRLEDFLAGLPPRQTALLLHRLLVIELDRRRGRGDAPTPEGYLDRFPNHRPLVEHAFAEQRPRNEGDTAFQGDLSSEP